jgi:hypothetical protein
MPRRRSDKEDAVRRVLATIVVMTLLAACGQGGGNSTQDTSDTDGGSTTTAPDESGGEESIAAFFGYGSDDPEKQEAQWRDEETRRQEMIRACMAEEGFDYTPVQQPEGNYSAWTPEDEEEMVRTQGFGITTWYGNEDQFEGDFEEWVDPNQEMVDAMSETERDAYYAALYGSEEEQMEGATTEIDPETGEEYTMIEGFGAGCEGEASKEIWGDQSQTDDLWQELEPEMTAMYERVQADPRIIALDEEWSDCMADAGYEYESQNQMYETIYEPTAGSLQQRFDEIVGPNGGWVDPMEGWTQEEIDAFFEEKTDDEINAFYEQAQQESKADIDDEALAALQQEEIDLAVAAFECRGDYYEVYQEVSEEYEAEFIAANRETLEKIREAQGG